MFRSGFVALLGRPNVGKSTLMNTLIGSKAAIISDKPQTTRNQIRGILTTDSYQLIFLDTPGVHKPRHKLGEKMVSLALRTLQEVDVILFLVDAAAGPGRGDEYIIGELQDIKTPVILVANKADAAGAACNRPLLYLLPLCRRSLPLGLTGANKEQLLCKVLRFIRRALYYPADMVTDQRNVLLLQN